MAATMKRQNSLQMLQENKGGSGGLGLCCGLPLAIAALVIASTYDKHDSDCDNDSFTIGLPTFLWTAGAVQLGMMCLGFCIQVLMFSAKDEAQKAQLGQLIGGPVCCSLLFYIVWASIGLNMYVNQMSEDCKSEDIGTMVFAWSLIEIILIGLFFCCICCLMFVFGAAAATS